VIAGAEKSFSPVMSGCWLETSLHSAMVLMVRQCVSTPAFSKKGGIIMECRVESKKELKLLVYFQEFDEETNKEGIPALWDAHHKKQIGKEVSCYFGVCADNGKKVFRYGIALYAEDVAFIPEGFEELHLPEHTWAVFRFEAPTPADVQNAWNNIKKEWLYNEEYDFAADYGLEYYPKDNICEIWIPCRKKG